MNNYLFINDIIHNLRTDDIRRYLDFTLIDCAK